MTLYAPKEAADLLRVHPKTFRRWAAESGVRPVVLRPNCRRFTEDQVLAIANARKARP
jgi:predicted site-specific integrase-resolvase